jgi:serine/threonine protein kinase
MRLIDFGSGCIDSPAPPGKVRDGIGPSSAVVVGGVDEEDNESYLPVHTTFAGSAFYISPELFQRSYNLKTDVWSAGG